jgi:hypothetical protein
MVIGGLLLLRDPQKAEDNISLTNASSMPEAN